MKRNNDVDKKVEEILELAREEKINEEEILAQSVQEKNKELNKQLLYLKAEFDNYRKRIEKEKQEKFYLGKISILEKILSLYDVFSVAIKNMEEKDVVEESKVFDGLKLIYKEFTSFLEKENVEKINDIGKKFDPLYHEVVSYIESDEGEDGVIIEIVSDGYKVKFDNKEIVLRPAKVKIIKNVSTQIKTEIETKQGSISSNKNETD